MLGMYLTIITISYIIIIMVIFNTSNLLSTVFTMISSGVYWLTSNLSLSSFPPAPSSSAIRGELRPFIARIIKIILTSIYTCSQEECPPITPVTPGNREEEAVVSLEIDIIIVE